MPKKGNKYSWCNNTCWTGRWASSSAFLRTFSDPPTREQVSCSSREFIPLSAKAIALDIDFQRRYEAYLERLNTGTLDKTDYSGNRKGRALTKTQLHRKKDR